MSNKQNTIFSKLNIKNLIVLLSFFITTSCTEKIDLKLDSTYARLVVEGYFTTDTMRHMIKLSGSGDALNHLPVQYISNAIVTISDGSNIFKLNEDPVNKGTYFTDPTVFGVPGKTYTLDISNVDVNGDGKKETYTAKSLLKPENPVDSIQIKYEADNPFGKGWSVYLYTQDIGGKNYYLIKLLKNNVLLTDSAHELTARTDNVGFEGKYFDGWSVYFLSQEKNNDEEVNVNDTITLELDGITEEYYNFVNDYLEEYSPKVPIFSGPSANISTNIEPKNKAVGFFAVYSVSRKSRIYK